MGDVMTDARQRSWISRLVAQTTVTLDSPLPRTECVERLQAELGSWWPLFRRRTVLGRVRADRFVLRKAKRLGPGQVCARGTLLPLASGTRVVMTLGRQRWQQALERLSVVVAMIGCTVSIVVTRSTSNLPRWAWLLFVFALGQTMLQAVRWPRQRREEARYLTELLQVLLEAPGTQEGRSDQERKPVVGGGS